MSQDRQLANSPPVTLINVFEVSAEHVAVVVAQWRQRAALMSTKPGFLDTRLHRALSRRTRFQLVNVAGKPRGVAGCHRRSPVPGAHPSRDR